jgi:hypothetical protein
MYRGGISYVRSSTGGDINLYVEDYDQFNSELLYKLDEYKSLLTYKITKFDKRIDLITNDIYGKSTNYGWIILYINKCDIDDLVRGKVINYIPIDDLNDIINSI